MTSRNNTRRALAASLLSLLICVAMLVGTTFAWFTDSVKSGANKIVAGNLDVALYHNGEAVTEKTENLFCDKNGQPIKWEPGAVAYENFEVKNEGSLSLKYRFSLAITGSNAVKGTDKTLRDVLKVAVVDGGFTGTTREDIAGLTFDPIADFVKEGDLSAGEGDTYGVVIYWEPGAEDDAYNLKNGLTASDGSDSLYIELGVNLEATQFASESDGFGSDYDKDAALTALPVASVQVLGPQKVQVLTDPANPSGGVSELDLETSYLFSPAETVDQAQASKYRFWHADFVVSVDTDVAAGGITLAGQYDLYGADWVAFSNPEAVTAGTEIRLIQTYGGGISVNYEELCNQVKEFFCGAAGNSIPGTKLTVELRLYETEEPSADNNNSTNVETGKYEVIRSVDYIFD